MIVDRDVNTMTIEELRSELVAKRRALSNYEIMMNRVWSRLDPTKRHLDNTKLREQIAHIIKTYGSPTSCLR